jgi:flagellar hook-associated protein 1 FlgK
MSVGSLFNVGSSALRAAYAQLQTTGHNIANVNTPGYSRQEVVLATAGADATGGGFIGRGVDTVSVRRAYDTFRTAEVTASIAAQAGDQARAERLGALDRMFADTENGIGAAIDDLTSAFADVVNRPFDSTARAVVVGRAETLAERFRLAAAGVEQMRETADQRLIQSVQTLNTSLQQLAAINDRIAKTSGTGQPPNDLLDQRDAAVDRINQTLKTSSYLNPDGTVSLFSAAGQALVVGNTVSRFSLAADSLDGSKLQIVLTTSGNDVVIPSEMLGGGELAGLMRFRDEDLESARARLGQLAAALGSAFNEQQALGRDPTGAPGAPMFVFGAPEVRSASDNAGSAVFSVAIADGGALKASDYTIDYDGSGYTLTRLSDGTQTSVAGWPQTVDGLTLDLASGTPQAGDRFLLRSGSAFAQDFRVVLSSGARLATGYAVTAERGAANAGDVAVRGFAVTSNDVNLTAPVTITFDGAGAFSVSGTGTGNPTGVAYTPGMTISYNGWSIELAGTPAAGDTLSIVPTANPSADNRNARAMLALADGRSVDGRRFTDAYAELLADIGLRSQGASATAAMSGQVLQDAKAAKAEVSGVNLDEEAARLMQYQQAYQAAAKLLATAQAIFETLLQAGGA